MKLSFERKFLEKSHGKFFTSCLISCKLGNKNPQKSRFNLLISIPNHSKLIAYIDLNSIPLSCLKKLNKTLNKENLFNLGGPHAAQHKAILQILDYLHASSYNTNYLFIRNKCSIGLHKIRYKPIYSPFSVKRS